MHSHSVVVTSDGQPLQQGCHMKAVDLKLALHMSQSMNYPLKIFHVEARYCLPHGSCNVTVGLELQ